MGARRIATKSIEKPTPNVHLGGLESLPEWVGPIGRAAAGRDGAGKDRPPPSN